MSGKTFALIPAYNEESTIGRVVALASAYVDVVVVVDDGSTDQTEAAAASAGAQVISVPHGGKGRAVQIGMAKAISMGGDVIVCLDADLQHNPNDIPRLVAPIESKDCEIVLGTRFHSQSAAVPWPIAAVNRLHARLVSSYLRRDFSDVTCGFRAFSRRAAEVLSWTAAGFGLEIEQLFSAVDSGLNIAEVPTLPYYGEGLQPKIDSRHVLRIVLDIYATLFRQFSRSSRGLLFMAISLPLPVVSFLLLISMVQLSRLRSRCCSGGRGKGHMS